MTTQHHVATDGSLLRCFTAGSVDDGKSTLIGRLLYDSKQIFADQLEHVEEASRRRGFDRTELALLTDGLRSEREQGITIDVAWRYFATPRRKFIMADTPGHVQYTRNMVTGASTADVAVILVDARNGVVEQSRRHASISALLGIERLVVCVNKMDLVGYDAARFEAIRTEFAGFLERVGARKVDFLPISALQGDNVVDRSGNMPWYQGPTLLEHLETLELSGERERADLVGGRFPVQWVIRPQSDEHHDFRGYAGQVAAGELHVGQRVRVLPTELSATVSRVHRHEESLQTARTGESLTLELAEDVDISRGDMLVPEGSRTPHVGQSLRARVCWMTAKPLSARGMYALKHTTRTVRARVETVVNRLNVNTLERASAEKLELNDLGEIELRTTAPIVYDAYDQCRATGSFILIDEATNHTVGAGMLLAPSDNA